MVHSIVLISTKYFKNAAFKFKKENRDRNIKKGHSLFRRSGPRSALYFSDLTCRIHYFSRPFVLLAERSRASVKQT